MIILRAFFLSFSIYWRFLIIIPLIALLFAAFILAALGIGFLLSLVSVPLALIAILAMVLIANAIPLLIALRLGASAKGEEVNGTYRDLFLPALGYGFIELLAVGALSAAGVFVLIILSPYSFADFQNLFVNIEDMSDVELQALGSLLPLLAAPFAILVAASIVRAALLVPMTASAVGAGMHGRSFPFLWKVGAGFIPLFPVCFVSFLAPVIIGIVGRQVLLFIGLDDEIREFWQAYESMENGRFFDLPFATEGYTVVAAAMLSLLWFFCLQAAAGVVAFRRKAANEQQTFTTERTVDRMSAEDLRAMRKSRQQSGI